MLSRKVIVALVVTIGGAGILVGSLVWASTRFDALDGGAPGSSTDILGVAAVVAGLVVAGKDVVDVGAAVAVMGDSSAAQTALEVGGPQARPLISC